MAKMQSSGMVGATQAIADKNSALQQLGLDLKSRWRRRRGSDASAPALGAAVEARYGGQKNWFRAKVVGLHGAGGYDLKYEDGDSEQNAYRHRIRMPGESEVGRLHCGQPVDAYHGGGQKAYPGIRIEDKHIGHFLRVYALY